MAASVAAASRRRMLLLLLMMLMLLLLGARGSVSLERLILGADASLVELDGAPDAAAVAASLSDELALELALDQEAGTAEPLALLARHRAAALAHLRQLHQQLHERRGRQQPPQPDELGGCSVGRAAGRWPDASATPPECSAGGASGAPWLSSWAPPPPVAAGWNATGRVYVSPRGASSSCEGQQFCGGSEQCACGSLQDGIDAAAQQHLALVLALPGDFSGPRNTNLSFHGLPIALVSLAGSRATNISCADGDAGPLLLFGANEPPATSVSGFTLTGCGLDLDDMWRRRQATERPCSPSSASLDLDGRDNLRFTASRSASSLSFASVIEITGGTAHRA